jgi:hypothetical protein
VKKHSFRPRSRAASSLQMMVCDGGLDVTRD